MRRLGDVRLPVEVLVEFADGRSRARDAGTASTAGRASATADARRSSRAIVDPERQDRARRRTPRNNSWVEERGRRAARRARSGRRAGCSGSRTCSSCTRCSDERRRRARSPAACARAAPLWGLAALLLAVERRPRARAAGRARWRATLAEDLARAGRRAERCCTASTTRWWSQLVGRAARAGATTSAPTSSGAGFAFKNLDLLLDGPAARRALRGAPTPEGDAARRPASTRSWLGRAAYLLLQVFLSGGVLASLRRPERPLDGARAAARRRASTSAGSSGCCVLMLLVDGVVFALNAPLARWADEPGPRGGLRAHRPRLAARPARRCCCWRCSAVHHAWPDYAQVDHRARGALERRSWPSCPRLAFCARATCCGTVGHSLARWPPSASRCWRPVERRSTRLDDRAATAPSSSRCSLAQALVLAAHRPAPGAPGRADRALPRERLAPAASATIPARMPVDAPSFRHALSQFATGVTVVTTRDAAGAPAGADRERVLLGEPGPAAGARLRRRPLGRARRASRSRGVFGVSVLARGPGGRLAALRAGGARRSSTGVALEHGETGAAAGAGRAGPPRVPRGRRPPRRRPHHLRRRGARDPASRAGRPLVYHARRLPAAGRGGRGA